MKPGLSKRSRKEASQHACYFLRLGCLSLRAQVGCIARVCSCLTRSNSTGLPFGFFFGCVRSSPLEDILAACGAERWMEECGDGKVQGHAGLKTRYACQCTVRCRQSSQRLSFRIPTYNCFISCQLLQSAIVSPAMSVNLRAGISSVTGPGSGTSFRRCRRRGESDSVFAR